MLAPLTERGFKENHQEISKFLETSPNLLLPRGGAAGSGVLSRIHEESVL